MKQRTIISIAIALLLNTYVAAQQIRQYEYFIDIDPGIGLAISSSALSADSVNIQLQIDVSGLAPGLHNLGLRFLNTDYVWSLTEYRTFYVARQQAQITAYEYFIDGDPGFGVATKVNIATTDSLKIHLDLAISDLSSGLHKLGIRFLNANNIWSRTKYGSFYVVQQIAPKIISAEYYFGDSVPPLEQGIPINLVTTGDSISFTVEHQFDTLEIGDYSISVRVMNANGMWSHPEVRTFSVCENYGADAEFTYHIEDNQVFFTSTSQYADTLKWDFDDGSTDTISNPIHPFDKAGVYEVKLEASNNCGKNEAVKEIIVPGLQYLNPNVSGDTGLITITFRGFGFTPQTLAQLIKDKQIFTPLQQTYVSENIILCIFDMSNKPKGIYEAVATTGNGIFDTLYSALHVEKAEDIILSVSINAPNQGRVGSLNIINIIQNNSNIDVIMTPFVTKIGFDPAWNQNPTFIAKTSRVFLENKGIFKNTYEYLNDHNVPIDVMFMEDVDSSRKKQMIAYYKVKIPGNNHSNEIVNSITLKDGSYENASMVQPPLLKVYSLDNSNYESDFKDCMNSFLKKEVKKLAGSLINEDSWNVNFDQSYDTLMKTLASISNDGSLQEQGVPVKAIFSCLLSQMAQCNNCGIPQNLGGYEFKKIVRNVTYNWLLWENLDSLGKPCMDSIISVSDIFNLKNNKLTNINNILTNQQKLSEGDDCPGDKYFPELAEQCKEFREQCDLIKNVRGAGGIFGIFSSVANKLTKPYNKWCEINSGSRGCKSLCNLSAVDPNQKFGPGNNSSDKYINNLQSVSYRIAFENIATATAPAAYVQIIDTIDENKFDISSIHQIAFGWGDSLVLIESNRKDYSLLKDLRPNKPNFLRIDITSDTINSVLNWKFYTLDTLRKELTDNPYEGFLPPNVDGVEGTGFVSFSIMPKIGITSGDQLFNKATIIFDSNKPISTPMWEYRIDSTSPESNIESLPIATNDSIIVLHVNSFDEHSGIENFQIYYVINDDSVYRKWNTIESNVDTFIAEYGNTYKFFSIAADKAHNVESPPDSALKYPDAITAVEKTLPISLYYFTAQKWQEIKVRLLWKMSPDNIHSHTIIERSFNGYRFDSLAKVSTKNIFNEISFIDEKPDKGVNYYRLKFFDKDGKYTYSPIRIARFDNSPIILVTPNPVNDKLQVFISQADGTIIFTDMVGKILKQINVTNQNTIIDVSNYASGFYFVKYVSTGKEVVSQSIIIQHHH